jgi:hypothetical protein
LSHISQRSGVVHIYILILRPVTHGKSLFHLGQLALFFCLVSNSVYFHLYTKHVLAFNLSISCCNLWSISVSIVFLRSWNCLLLLNRSSVGLSTSLLRLSVSSTLAHVGPGLHAALLLAASELVPSNCKHPAGFCPQQRLLPPN